MMVRKVCCIMAILFAVWPLGCMMAQRTMAPSVRSLPTRAQMPVANVNAVVQDVEGYMWYATYEGGLCRDDGYRIDVFRRDREHKGLLSDNVVHGLCEAADGAIWFSTARSVYVLDKHNYSIRPVNAVFRTIGAREIRRLENGNMRVASDRVVMEVTASGRILSARHEKYQGRKVMVQPDGEGGFWICHAEHDLCYAQGDTANVVRRYDVAAKNILHDGKGKRLFAITPDGLQMFPAAHGVLCKGMNLCQDIPEIGVYGLYLDKRRQLWMTGYQPSFTIVTPSEEESHRKLNIGSAMYGSVYVDRLLPLGEDRLAVFKDIRYLSEYRLDTDSETLVSSDTVSPPPSWREDGELLATVERQKDIDTLLVKDATKDGRGHVWVVFDQHVREISLQTRRWRDISATGCDMGMNNFCCIAAVEGGVCVGGAGGVCFFASNGALDADSMEVPVGISAYEVTTADGQTKRGFLYPDGKVPMLQLGHDCTCLTLCLTSFNHLHAPNIRFAIRVEGLDGDWVCLDEGESVFRLLNLPKGDYRVWLRATDEEGLWGDCREVLAIRRHPAWWESGWAYAAYVLLLAAALAGAFCLYRYVQRKREQFDHMLRLLKDAPAQPRPVPHGAADEHNPESGLSAQDRAFSHKAIEAVKANLDNESYTVDMMAQTLCMSRVNLYRRMMTVCGQTPSDFIRTLRMEHAYHLLTTTDLPVNLVASQCGFTSSSYFAKCFRARFGMLPTALRG